MKKSFMVFMLLLLLPGTVHAGSRAEEVLAKIPVQEGGRTKPYQSFAREAVLRIVGRTSFEGMDSTLLTWQWVAQPDKWSLEPIIPVKRPEMRDFFASDLQKNRIAPALVLANLDFAKEVRALQMKDQKKERLTTVEKKKIELYGRASFFEAISKQRVPGFVPHPIDPKVSWLPLEAIGTEEGVRLIGQLYPSQDVANTSTTFAHLLDRLRGDQVEEAATAAEHFSSSLTDLLATRQIVLDDRRLGLELLYFKLKPFRLAWILYLLSVIVWSLPRRTKKASAVAFSIFCSAFFVHTCGFVLRVLISGRAPVTNMYETVVWVPWGTVLFSIVLWLFFRSPLLPTVSAVVATFALILANGAPVLLDPAISPLVPVLRSNFWLTIHVLTITLSYGALALNWGFAHALLYNLAFHRGKKKRIEHLTQYLYRAMQIGIILLGTGTVLGGVWASYSWGRFWGWDPKETWALIALMSYLAVFHGRIAGWLDQFGVAFSCAIAFLTVIMAWYGVNFVLGVGLHSYGFGGGGLNYVLAAVAVDVAFLLYLRRKYQMKAHRARA